MGLIPHYVETAHCVICRRAFFRKKKDAATKRCPEGVRGKNCQTCSRECSRKYCAISSRCERKKLKEKFAK